MRGLVALWVFSYHLGLLAPAPMNDRSNLMAKGYLGVDFFFLLSGFVLASAYGDRFRRSFDFALMRRFVVRRAGRIFPLHLFVTAFCVLFAWMDQRPYSPVEVIQESALIHRWPFVSALSRPINAPAWSISTELLANLLFPLFVVVTLNSSRSFATLVGLTAFVLLSVISWMHDGSLNISHANSIVPTVRCFSEFAMGMLIYRWRKLGSTTVWAAITLGFACCLPLVWKTPDSIMVICMAPVILAVSRSSGMVEKAMSFPPLHYLGKISFAIYLVHLRIIKASNVLTKMIFPLGHDNLFFIDTALCLTFITAIITHKFIEAPAIAWTRKHSNILWRHGSQLNDVGVSK